MKLKDANTIIRTAYLTWLRSEIQLLPVIPIKAADRTARLPLEDVYVQLRVTGRTQSEAFERITKGEFGSDREHRMRMRMLERAQIEAFQPLAKDEFESDRGRHMRSEGAFAFFSDLPSSIAPYKMRSEGAYTFFSDLPSSIAPYKIRRTTQSRIERMLLIGDAGSGKTTTLHYGALTLVDALLHDDATSVRKRINLISDPLPFPIYIRLTFVMKWLREKQDGQQFTTSANPMLDWLDSQVVPQIGRFLTLRAAESTPPLPNEPVIPAPADWQAAIDTIPLSAIIRSGGCLILLDGLDETGDAPRRSEMQRWISDLAQSCPNNRYLVATRPFKGIQIAGFAERHLSPLNGSEIQSLLGKWFGAAYQNDPNHYRQRSVSEEVDYLWAILEQNSRLFDMCTNPLLLTSVALLVYTGVGLPRERAELYNRLVYLLLETWRVLQLSGGRLPESQTARPVLFGESVSSVQRRLQQLAARMQTEQRREATQDEIAIWLAPQYAEDMEWNTEESQAYVTKLLDSLALDSGILQRREAGFSFTHYTLQEYLTARDYDQRPDGIDQLLALRTEARWKEAILLAIGHWVTSGVTEKARVLLRGLLDTNEVDALLLVGDALNDADASRVPDLAPVRRIAIARLRNLAGLSTDWASIAHPDPMLRNRAATMLDRHNADNERPGLDLTRADYWATRIEPGKFSMGDNNGKWDDEKPQFDYVISQPYALARFPVTNRQYLLFVEALAGRGSTESRAAAQKLLQLMEQHKQTPEDFHPRYWPGAHYRTGEGNYPVVGVTWYAATAFAWWADAWLHALGVLTPEEALHLPTEAEWERAAAYPPMLLHTADTRAGRSLYPWDTSPNVTAPIHVISARTPANTRESTIRGASVLGIFPHGAAACGAEDLAGNVWEWCSTPKLTYPIEQEVGAESIYIANRQTSSLYVLRGGAWNTDVDRACCAFRAHIHPTSASSRYGFRLACLLSLSS
ncbi:SUMF1/EgtB/PvdO family nonheme iron enzyme [Oscillochloris sp. ZM17-4]|uniref:NACHT domain-containing protein n=1 Tax=Oscillochloris sp. ZM17-4 TaxID=2866714 RepID=UPI001C73940C|nr:SUMF1/EgtB/PvdO family nonheme iron enzyme [Oscillochloris sp. ZM17-4]MBX0326586.1 SUMF1/EgtB/PvdO family nonheme iron enzyme [Oscillochloris sp. ZM17-4]